MGKIITLQDGLYQYELPPLPPEKEIWYYDLPKDEQYWKTPSAKNFKWLNEKGDIRNVKRMEERERVEYINYWRRVWEEGLWIMINGEPTYLTGAHVEHLVFNKFENRYLYYLDSQRERFYFRDLTDKDPLCDGRCWPKGRRVGITTEQITYTIRAILSDFSNHASYQSDTLVKAKSSLLDKTIDTYVKRVDWMRESFYNSNGKVPRSKLELIDTVVRDDDNYPLGGSVRAFPTTAKACDGEQFIIMTMDELSKPEDVSPYEMFEVNKRAIVNPGKRGKIDALSTTGDSKESQKSVKDWHKLIANSNPLVRNKNGTTNSGLWHFFVSYIHSLELLERHPDIMDKFGKVNREKAEEYIWNEVKQYSPDSKEYVYALYKMPTEMRHALLTPTGQGNFSKVRITKRLDELRQMPYDEKPYVIGSLELDQKGNVYFESNAERRKRCEEEKIAYNPGYWMVAQHPYVSSEKGIDTRNRFRKSGRGERMPPINPEGAIGYDPVRYKTKDTSSNKLSKASIIVHKSLDYFGANDANRYCALYLHRPDDPRTANMECIKAALYWGFPVMHERVIETVKEDFEEMNCVSFLLRNPKDNLHGMWIDGQGKVVQNATDWMVARFSAPKNDEDIDQIDEMPFEDVLTDLDGFDISNTTSYDVYMSMVELEHGLKQIKFTNTTDTNAHSRASLKREFLPKRS